MSTRGMPICNAFNDEAIELFTKKVGRRLFVLSPMSDGVGTTSAVVFFWSRWILAFVPVPISTRQYVSFISSSSQACNCNRTRRNLGPFCYVMNTNYNLLVTFSSVLAVAGQPVSDQQTWKLMIS